MVYGVGSAPTMLSSSPPARSPSLPIKRGASKSSSLSAKPSDLPVDKRASDDGYRRSSGSRTPFANSSSSNGRPPMPPPAPARAQQVLMGFDAPSSTPPRASAPPPAARMQTRASLLSQQLLDTAFSRSADLDDMLSPRDVKGFKAPMAGPEDDAGLKQLQEQHEVFRSPVVATAYAMAARAHAGQVRKNGEPVLSHAVATATILAELGLSEQIVAAGLLHDVLCDTRLTACQLEEYLPREVVALVEKVTHISQISQLYRDNTHTLEAEKLLDMLTTMADVSALLIKLADRLHNMRTIGALPRCKQVRLASETMEVFSVLANRLGAWAIKAELEDLSFKTLNPEDYASVAAAIQAHTADSGAATLCEAVNAVTAALTNAGLSVVDVSARVKNVYGVWKKLKDSGSNDVMRSIREVYDVQALRVVVPHKHDCYAALRAVESLWAPVPGRFKDYIRNRKANGYQSLHTTVRDAQGRALEVQIRTPKMHYIAEYGFAAHWRYKEQLQREDLWLDRLVQWKKWVVTKKLGILDRKVRSSGSPGRDVALEEVAAALGLGLQQPAAAADDEAVIAGASLQRTSAAVPWCSGEDVAEAVEQQLREVVAGGLTTGPVVAAAVVGPLSGNSPPGAAASPSQQQQRAAESAQRFVERFGLRPITESDLAARDATVLVSGPRGVHLMDVPPGSTVAHLLSSPAFQDQGLWATAVKVNGQLVNGMERWERVLKAGDQVELFDLTWVPAAAPAAAGSGPGGGRGSTGGGAAAEEVLVGAGAYLGRQQQQLVRQDSQELQELQRQLRTALATAAVR